VETQNQSASKLERNILNHYLNFCAYLNFRRKLNMFWLKLVSNFIKILREGQTPAQVAGGFALGSILGLSPMLTLQGIGVWLVILILDVNLSAATLALLVLSLFAYVFDPLFHQLGYFLLVDVDSLKGLWTTLYNAPIAPLTRFNNTIVMGSFVCALILFTPIYIGMKKFVIAYRSTVGKRIEKMKIYQVISKSWIVQTYQRVRDLGV
jgi:uncharacterized protein (TIGR03546 family)